MNALTEVLQRPGEMSEFLKRRLAQRERELGFEMREYLARHEHPPEELRAEHRRVWLAKRAHGGHTGRPGETSTWNRGDA